MSLDSPRSARTTAREWATAIRGRSPRTARRIASELAELVDRSGIGGPVVLVAASSGGFNVRVLASDHPDRVAGLVLVDASHEDQRA